MKESDARKKFCPYMPRQITRVGLDNDPGFCQGAQCMMWEPEVERQQMTIDVPKKNGEDFEEYESIVKSLVPADWHVQGSSVGFHNAARTGRLNLYRYETVDRGDCGLKATMAPEGCGNG